VFGGYKRDKATDKYFYMLHTLPELCIAYTYLKEREREKYLSVNIQKTT